MAKTTEDPSKLPQWARFLIDRLETENKGLEQKLKDLVAKGESTSEVGYRVLGDEGMEFRPLPSGTVIVFRLDQAKGREVEVKMARDRSTMREERIQVYGRDPYGVGSIAIRPTSSNTAEVFLDPADQNENRS